MAGRTVQMHQSILLNHQQICNRKYITGYTVAQVIVIFRISINMTPLDGVCVCYNKESLVVGHCRVFVWGVPRSLYAKDLICRFRNRGGAL